MTKHEELKKALQEIICGEVEDSEKVIEEYSRDTSLFRVVPELVVFPRNSEDLYKLVRFANENRAKYPNLSFTARSAGTDMTGGPLSESVVLSFTRHFNCEDLKEENMEVTVEPGLFYRDLEKDLIPEHLSFPSYPASKTIAAMGGIVMNNSGGERSLRWGKTADYVKTVSMVLADGNEYDFGRVSLDELEAKKRQEDFEGEVYRKMDALLKEKKDIIQESRPTVSKNSAGYNLWDIRGDDTFDLSKLFVGSQGTLGLLTKARIRLVCEKKHKKMLVLFFKSWDNLPEVVNKILPYDPESLETFDRDTMKLGLRFLPEIAKKTGRGALSFALHFLPEVWIGVKMLGMPKLVTIVELAEDDAQTAEQKARDIKEALRETSGLQTRILPEEEEEKYWMMRRQSFNLLRKKVRGKVAAPFVEDFCIDPDKLPEFLPKFLDILKRHQIKANLVGHAGNGNFHTIPLMDLTKESEREKIVPVMDEVTKLTREYGGTITAEHNDGILRTPYLEQMFGSEMVDVFEKVKDIFDPNGIFNPGKKVGGSKEYLKEHITAHNGS